VGEGNREPQAPPSALPSSLVFPLGRASLHSVPGDLSPPLYPWAFAPKPLNKRASLL
jgi:hypothetical protein